MTGYGQESDRERTHQAGFDFHLVKPTDPTKVQQLLAKLANQRLEQSRCDLSIWRKQEANGPY